MGKIIQNTESSSSGRRDTNSNTASQGSKSQKSASKSIGVAYPVRKDIISTGNENDDDDDDKSSKDNEGNKRNKYLRKNKIDGLSTD